MGIDECMECDVQYKRALQMNRMKFLAARRAVCEGGLFSQKSPINPIADSS